MTFLDEVLQGVRHNLQNGYYDNRRPESINFNKASLKTALLQTFRIIAEIKPRSPTAGRLYDGKASALAEKYAQAGAGAISVLCEKTHFGGRLENLTESKVAGLPVLAKDFVVSEKQLQAFAEFGADAALLIYELFERKKTEKPLGEMIDAAHAAGLEVLLEVHDQQGLKDALESDADVIGINNRDLDDLSLNVLHFQNVLNEATVDPEKIQKPIIAESGFASRDDVRLARKAGLSGVLIGTGLLEKTDPKAALVDLVEA